jgi:hypothetical protein
MQTLRQSHPHSYANPCGLRRTDVCTAHSLHPCEERRCENANGQHFPSTANAQKAKNMNAILAIDRGGPWGCEASSIPRFLDGWFTDSSTTSALFAAQGARCCAVEQGSDAVSLEAGDRGALETRRF